MDNLAALRSVINTLEKVVSNLPRTKVSRPEKKRSVGLVVREERGRGSEVYGVKNVFLDFFSKKLHEGTKDDNLTISKANNVIINQRYPYTPSFNGRAVVNSDDNIFHFTGFEMLTNNHRISFVAEPESGNDPALEADEETYTASPNQGSWYSAKESVGRWINYTCLLYTSDAADE